MKTIGIWMLVVGLIVGSLLLSTPACAGYWCSYQTIQVPDPNAPYPGAIKFIYCTRCCQTVGRQMFCNTTCN